MVGVLQRRWWVLVVVVLVMVGVGSTLSHRTPIAFRAEAQLAVTGADRSGGDGASGERRLGETLSARVATLNSRSFLRRVEARARGSARAAQVQLKGSAPVGDGLLVLTAVSPSAAIAAAWANLAADEYVRLSTATERRGALSVRRYLAGEQARQRLELIRADSALQVFQSGSEISANEEQQTLQLREALALQAESRKVEAELKASSARLRDLKSQVNSAPAVTTQLFTEPNPEYLKIRERLADTEARRTEMLGSYTEDSRVVRDLTEAAQQLRSRLAQLRPLLQEPRSLPNESLSGLERQISEEQSRQAELREKEKIYAGAALSSRAPLANLGSKQMRLGELVRSRDEAAARLAEITRRLGEETVRDRGWTAAVRVLEPALRPGAPIPNGSERLALLFVGGGLLLGMGLVLLIELLDDRVKGRGDLDPALPLLGSFPALAPHRSVLSLGGDPSLPFQRSARALAARLGSLPGKQSLMVTGDADGVGKSVVSANIAVQLAEAGRRVVLVDSNLDAPGIHRMFGLHVSPGLADVLRGAAELSQVLHPTPQPNFSIVCAGTAGSDAVSLLESPAMGRLLSALRENNDTLVLDAPSVGCGAQTELIAERVDGAVLVAAAGESRRRRVTSAWSWLEGLGVEMLGVVLNRASGTAAPRPAVSHGASLSAGARRRPQLEPGPNLIDTVGDEHESTR